MRGPSVKRKYDPKASHSISHPLIGKTVAYVREPHLPIGIVVRVDHCDRAIVHRHCGDFVRRVTTRLVEVA